METTLKEIGISIIKGVVCLVDKIINAKIKITAKTVGIALLIILFGFIAILIIANIFWPAPPSILEQWEKRQEGKGKPGVDIFQEWEKRQEGEEKSMLTPEDFEKWLKEEPGE